MSIVYGFEHCTVALMGVELEPYTVLDVGACRQANDGYTANAEYSRSKRLKSLRFSEARKSLFYTGLRRYLASPLSIGVCGGAPMFIPPPR